MELISPAEYAKGKVQSVQDYVLLSMRSLGNLFQKPLYLADMAAQADAVGVGSLPIVLSACFFTGAALALNSASTLSRFGALTVTGQLVSVGIIRELGPVLAGLVVAGRDASGMASELGSMVVTEQIDAMRALGTDPVKKLVTPRVISTVFMLIFLTILGDFLGLIGGSLVASGLLGLDFREYWTYAWQTLAALDITMGLIKPLVFGFIVATVGCYYGMSAKGGTQGVGRATTEAVVTSMILIIAVDVLITRFVLLLWGA